MNRLSVLAFLVCFVPVSGAYAQSGLSNGAQSGVVQSPATASPSVQQPGSFSAGNAAPGGQGIIPPQAPTMFSPAGSPAPLAGGPATGPSAAGTVAP